MRLATRFIRYRDVIASASFVPGRRWSSPSSGASLVIVGSPGDADDPSRASSLYVEDDRLSWTDMPELAKLFPKGYKLARRLDDDGIYRRAAELICVPVDGDGAASEIDLRGYGPDEWFHDGVTGAEMDAAARTSDGWRTVVWPDHARMSLVPALKAGQVIRSAQFAQAHVRRTPDGIAAATLYHMPFDPEIEDPPRGAASYLVESVRVTEEWTDLGEYYSCRVQARRLPGEDGVDPRETLAFQQQMDTRDEPYGRPFRAVEILGSR